MRTAAVMQPTPKPADIEVRLVYQGLKQSRVQGRFSYLVVVPTYQFKACTTAGQDWLEDELGLRCKGVMALQHCVEGDRARDEVLGRMELDGLRVVELWRKPHA